MLPSAYQIRTGIRKTPWLLTQGVRDGGIGGEILNQGSLLCCFSSCCHNPTVFPTGRHHPAKTTQGPRDLVWGRDPVSFHWSHNPDGDLKNATFGDFLALRIKQTWEGNQSEAVLGMRKTEVLKWIMDHFVCPGPCRAPAKWFSCWLDCGDRVIPAVKHRIRVEQGEKLLLQATAFCVINPDSAMEVLMISNLPVLWIQ